MSSTPLRSRRTSRCARTCRTYPFEDDIHMMLDMNRSRWVVATGLLATALIAGCDRLKSGLLDPQNPGLIDPSAVGTPTSALALRVGAIGRYNQVITGEGVWEMAGPPTDE